MSALLLWPMPAPHVCIVSPVLNEEQVLPQLFDRLTGMFASNPLVRWEVVLVDDGSTDGTAKLISERARIDPRFRLVSLSRNFGFQAAFAAGLDACSADAVVPMDADLQDPPEVIPMLVAAWLNGADVVRAVRRSRAERGPRRIAFDLFHLVYGKLTDYPIPRDSGTFGLLSRKAKDAMCSLPERHRFLPGLRAWIGFSTAEILYDRMERAGGVPQQSFRRLVRYALDGLFSFSYLPLRLLTIFGIGASSAGFLLGIYYAIRRLASAETAPTGFTTLVTLLLFMGGAQMIGMGVIGEYLGRIYDESKRRPLYLLNNKREDSSDG